MDRIFLNQLEFYGYHGVLPEENKIGQRFIVDLTLELDIKEAGKTDDLNKTINYANAYTIVKDIVEGTPVKLIETLAETIANSLLDTFAILESCIIKVIKPDPPIPGHYKFVAVEIRRGRNG